ncbi:MAG: hypothetical protein PHT33_06080, partial [bacterium]|nr:hypothetical protein [bacterium]
MMTNLQQNERALVRELGLKVAEIAHEPRMQGIMQRWRDVNALRKPDRAPVWCKPVRCWLEILPPDTLVCTDPWLKSLEYSFRQILHKRDIDDDTPVEPYFKVEAIFDVEPSNYWGVDIKRHLSGEDGGAWAYEPPLKSSEDY